MIGSATILRSCLLPIALLCTQQQTPAKKDGDPIPSDLKIVAQYGAGYSPWKSWKFTISGDGKVAKEWGFSGGGKAANKDDSKSSEKDTKLSKKHLRELVAKIKEADFYGLQEKYSYRVTDSPRLVLTITQDKKTHRVEVYAYSHLKDDKDVKRFLRVWSEFLRKVPSPNPDQKPEIYEPQPSKSAQPSSNKKVSG